MKEYTKTVRMEVSRKRALPPTIITAIVMSLLVSSSSLAATINDIREATGNIRSDTEEFRQQAQDTIANYTEINDMNEYVDFINSFNLDEKYRKELEDEQATYEAYEKVFIKSFNDCGTYKKVMADLSKIRDQAKVVQESESKLSGVIGKTYTENTYEEAYMKVRNLLESQDDLTDYGIIGDKLKPLLSNKITEIYLPYGNYYTENGDVAWNYGLYLKTPSYTDVELKNLFNGECVNKYQDSNGQYVLEIQSGSYLKTTYWYIDESNIEIGDKINQYGIIGKILAGHDKVYFDIRLDGEYVNPLMILGNTGKTAYDKYIAINGEKLESVESLETRTQYSDKDIESTKPNNSSVDKLEITSESKGYDNEISDDILPDGDIDLVPEDIRKKEQSEIEKASKEAENRQEQESKGNRVHKLE